MTTLNLNTITSEIFETIIRNLIGTNCTMEFDNYTEEHAKIALNLGLTICTGNTLEISSEADNANNHY